MSDIERAAKKYADDIDADAYTRNMIAEIFMDGAQYIISSRLVNIVDDIIYTRLGDTTEKDVRKYLNTHDIHLSDDDIQDVLDMVRDASVVPDGE